MANLTALCRFFLIIVTLSLVPGVSSAQDELDEILSVVDACDILAAHPDDPLRVAPGVPDEELVPRLALEACFQALVGSDDSARHAFQLGRAQLELGRREEALESFRIAADAGSAIALVFLGDAAQFGWTNEPNLEAARALYAAAVEKGLVVANLALAQVTFDPSLFTTGEMLNVLFLRDTDLAVQYASSELAPAYLYALALELSERCGAFLTPPAVPALQFYRFPTGWSPALEEGDQRFGRQDVLATYDVEVLVDRHGCSGIVIEAIADTYNDMLLTIARQGRAE